MKATPNSDGTYDVTYKINVMNIGGTTWNVTALTDTPSFDDDITINEGSYSGGLVCCGAFMSITFNRVIRVRLRCIIMTHTLDAGLTDTYTLIFNVTLDLEEGSR